MKTKLFLGVAAAIILGLSSCDNASKLADNVQGKWEGGTTQMSKGNPDKHKDRDHKDKKDGERREKVGTPRDGNISISITPTVTFTLDKGTNGGKIDLSARYTVSQPVLTHTDSIAPVKATVSGIANASGTWMAKDDDDIHVTLDSSKTTVTVDPASLTLDYAVLTDRPTAELDSLKANVAANIEPVVKTLIQERISHIREFEDVKFVNPTTMKLEIGHDKVTFTKK